MISRYMKVAQQMTPRNFWTPPWSCMSCKLVPFQKLQKRHQLMHIPYNVVQPLSISILHTCLYISFKHHFFVCDKVIEVVNLMTCQMHKPSENQTTRNLCIPFDTIGNLRVHGKMTNKTNQPSTKPYYACTTIKVEHLCKNARNKFPQNSQAQHLHLKSLDNLLQNGIFTYCVGFAHQSMLLIKVLQPIPHTSIGGSLYNILQNLHALNTTKMIFCILLINYQFKKSSKIPSKVLMKII